MKKIFQHKLIVTILIILLLFVGATKAKTIEDLAGREIMIPQKIEKIVAVGPGSLRLLVYLNLEEKIVGIEEFEKRNQKRPYILANSKLLDLPIIGPQFGGDSELISAQNPDLIIASYLSSSQLNNLQNKTSIPVVSINNGSAGSMTEEEFKEAINFLSKLLSKEDRATQLINFFNKSKEELSNRTKGKNLDISLYIGGIGNKGAQGIISTESNYPPFKYINLKNIIEGKKKKNFSINKERLLLENPEIIFIDQGGIEIVKQNLKRKEFQYLKSYQKNNIYELLPYNHYSTNFDTMLANSYYIAKILYPNEFQDLDPKTKADEIYKNFVGRPVYAEMAEIFGGFKKMDLNQFENKEVK